MGRNEVRPAFVGASLQFAVPRKTVGLNRPAVPIVRVMATPNEARPLGNRRQMKRGRCGSLTYCPEYGAGGDSAGSHVARRRFPPARALPNSNRATGPEY